MATAVFTSGQILIGTIDVFAPVNKDNPARTMSIRPDVLYTIIETGFFYPAKMVVIRTSSPMKHNVRPSVIHSMVIIRLLSFEMAPKLSTMDLVGTI